MLLSRKIVLSNVLMVVVPVLVTALFCLCYMAAGGPGLTPINHATSGNDRLSASQNALNTLEAGLSKLTWDVVYVTGEHGPEAVLSPSDDELRALEDAGFHVHVESSDDLLFSNADEGDLRAIEDTRTNSDGSVAWSGTRLVVQDEFMADSVRCHLFAVYNEARASDDALFAMQPIYSVTPTALVVFATFAVASVALTALVLTRWLAKSVAEPLDELKAAAQRVEEGDLERRISYPKQDEFGEVCGVFDNMRQRLRQAEIEKTRYEENRRELLRGVSHDLRSPLTSIVGYASGIKDGIANTPEKRERYCDAILTRAGDLERMMNSLSVLTRAEGGGVLHKERVVVSAFVADLVEDKRAWLASNAVAVALVDESNGAEALLDTVEMGRVLNNLFENTVRHRTAHTSQVSVKTTVLEGRACIRYADDGPGVPAEHLERIFESFYRVDEARTKQGEGSGLGLAIVRRIVEGHGGTVSGENDRGLAIAIQLPLAEGAS